MVKPGNKIWFSVTVGLEVQIDFHYTCNYHLVHKAWWFLEMKCDSTCIIFVLESQSYVSTKFQRAAPNITVVVVGPGCETIYMYMYSQVYLEDIQYMCNWT